MPTSPPLPHRAALSIEVGPGTNQPPPKEFRVFKAGPNPTVFGTFTFDAKASALVMAAAQDYGNDYSVDYCHAMIDAKHAVDPAKAGKAAGWFTVELRGGELWAVNVTWTPEATAALTAREFRYISQVFNYLEDGTISELINVALTNTPANKDLEPLMASRSSRGTSRAVAEKPMEEMKKAMAKLAGLPETATAEEIQAALTAKLAAAAPEEDEDAEADEKQDPAAAKCGKCAKSLGKKDKFCAQCGAPAADEEEGEEDADDADDDEADDKEDLPPAAQAAMSRLQAKLTRMRRLGQTVRAELARIEGERLAARFEAEAAGYKALAQDPKVFGKVLLSLHQKAPEAKKAIDHVLRRANAALSTSPLFHQSGRGGDAGSDTVMGRVDKLIEELQRSEAGRHLSHEQALKRIVDATPALYEQYTTEKAAAQRQAS